ncbi:MAG TPA: DNA-formamidopyrimidine glycosylase, partial [Candidatus Caenarcaniphilales bacterium]
MPELPEVEIICRGLNQVTLGQAILGGDVLLARTIAHPTSMGEFLSGLRGAAISRWQRRGKYLLAELIKPAVQVSSARHQSAGWLGVHLRMTGQLLWVDPAKPLQKHTRVRLFLGSERELRFIDQRTFGQLWWVAPSENRESVIKGLQKLGREPFAPDFTVAYLIEQFHHRRRPIKSALLDQTIVAGLGNIYADEALFLSGIGPETLCAMLEPAQIERLRSAIVQVLETSIAKGGTTFSSFLNVQGINGNYSGVAWVYSRKGQPCRVCATPVQRLKL